MAPAIRYTVLVVFAYQAVQACWSEVPGRYALGFGDGNVCLWG